MSRGKLEEWLRIRLPANPSSAFLELPPKHFRNLGEAQAFTTQLVEFLEHSLSSSISSTNAQKIIAATEIVERIPFYGFHAHSCFFVKIYTFVPGNIRKLADLCFRFPARDLILQPHESHISYLSQFMIDYNLYGMNFIRLSNPRFRLPLPRSDTFPWRMNEIPFRRLSYMSNMEANTSLTDYLNSQRDLLNIPLSQRLFLSEYCEELSHSHCLSPLERKSYCDLELDVNATDILNPEDCKEIPSLEAASEEDRLVPSLRGLWEEDGRRRSLLGMESYSNGGDLKDKCKVNLSYSEAHLREVFLRRLEQEQRKHCNRITMHDNVVNTNLGLDIGDTNLAESKVVVDHSDVVEERTKQGHDVEDRIADPYVGCFKDDRSTECLWNDILQSSQLLEQDIKQEMSQDFNCTPTMERFVKEMTHTEGPCVLSNQNNEGSFNVVKNDDDIIHPECENDLNTSSQRTNYLNSVVNEQLETNDTSSASITTSMEVHSDANGGNQSLPSQRRNSNGIVWITPCDSPPTVEDLNAASMNRPLYNYVPQVVMDSYGRLNTRFAANSFKGSEENAKSITNIARKDDFSSSEDEDVDNPPESHAVRPSSPRYDEMDGITTPAQSQKYDQSKTLHRRSLGLNDSFFFSPGFAVETEYNMSSRRESSVGHSYQQDDELLPHQSQGLTLMSLEVITEAREGKLPDPAIDAVHIVCMVIHDERAKLHLGPTYQDIFHVILLAEDPVSTQYPYLISDDISIQMVSNEEELFYKVAHWIRYYDIDMIFGYDIHRSSLGYLIERGHHLGWAFTRWISRWKETKPNINTWNNDEAVEDEEEESVNQDNCPIPDASRADTYMKRLGCHIKITGRYVFGIWNILRVQVKLPYYDYEGASAALLKKRIPAYEPWVLGSFLQKTQHIHIAYEYCLQKAADNFHFLEELDWVSQTSELARIFGIDFRSVITRGSQFRVESMLARLAHANGYLLLSASREQLLSQPAMECLPLVMEPVTNFYQDPVIVMDFQSLYPSIIIAHNMCFSTMFGNVRGFSQISHFGSCRMGVLESFEPPSLLSVTNDNELSSEALYERYCNDYYVAPNGECFVTSKIRKGILPRLLQEILSTRLMIKSSMKWIAEHYQGEYKDRLWKILNAQQFALKLIANVTYGYTSAAFSGRMPCSGLADAIVQHGRQAMKRSMEEIERGWQQVRAHTVYGDTDSLFVFIPEMDWRQGWKLGKEISEHISGQFPYPMRLVLEKVYMPCILLVKKRYVGYAFESLEQQRPVLDAKGIETIRRDSCAAVQKLIERSLRLLFETRKISKVKEYLLKKWSRMHRGNFHWMDFIFYMEVRWGSYRAQMEASSQAMLPPAAVVASRRVFHDSRAIPLYGERIPFLIAYWMEKPRTLQDCVCSPEEFLSLQENGHAVLHVTYYIIKQMIPALQRFFDCLGVDINQWYQQMRRPSTLLSWLMEFVTDSVSRWRTVSLLSLLRLQFMWTKFIRPKRMAFVSFM
ncbi:DNA polymerase zeta catalytic subunit [Galdieria sulphuraria]|nr:DNA polymerase zeta catalytic subunit [Galdieria sulphuraria]